MTLWTVSCNMKQPSPKDNDVISKKDTVDIMKAYPELAERLGKIESTPLGNYFILTLATDSTCKLEWGNKKIKRQSTRDYFFNEARRLHLDWENNEFLVLKVGQGSDTWINIFLPLDNGEQEQVIGNALTKDKDKNLVVAEYPSSDTTMIIHNLKTKEVQYIIETNKCGSAFNHYCIDTITFTNKGLYYKWTLPDKLDDNPKRYDRRVEIKI